MKIAHSMCSFHRPARPCVGRFCMLLWLLGLALDSRVALSAEPADDQTGGAGRLSIEAGGGRTETRVVPSDGSFRARPTSSSIAAGTDDSADAPKSQTHPLTASRSRRRRSGVVQAAATTPAATDPIEVTADAAGFKGILPGRATRDDVQRGWGAPQDVKQIEGGLRLSYQIEPFAKVVVNLQGEQVTAIVIYLAKPVASATLAKQLDIDGIVSVAVTDERGQPLGEAYPERGVLFAYAPKLTTPQVLQVVVEPVNSQPFLLRAETRYREFPAHSLADANFVLTLDPQNARAHWLRAQSLAQMGKYVDALPAAQQAHSLEPGDLNYRLTLARAMADLGDHEHAEEHVEDLVTGKQASPILEAQAYCLWGDCLANAADHDYRQAMQYHQQAIDLAQQMVSDSIVSVRRAAKEVLVDAHLGVAHDIAVGRWQQKHKVVPKWLARAKGFADDLAATEKAGEGALQRVHESAMTSLAAIPTAPNSEQWIAATKRLGAKLIAEAEPQRRGLLEWHMGVAMSDAVVIEQAQGHPDQALELGELAAKFFDASLLASEQVPAHEFIVGRLYYRLGAMAAMDRQDHKAAMNWYDKAVPLLESPVPPLALTDPGRQGDMFVSMGVSYWEKGARKESLRLTRQGVRLIEQAVEDGLAPRQILAIPYGNLATMFGETGDQDGAHHYSELAARCDPAPQK